MKEEINPQKSAIGERRFNKKFTKLKISEKYLMIKKICV